MKKSPFESRDLNKQLRFPVLSWSSMNAFESYNKDIWYEQYVLGNKSKPNAHMLAGITIGHKLVEDPAFLSEVPRPEIYEYEESVLFEEIQLVGHMDGWSPKTKKLLEYKTTVREDKWTQSMVDSWGQITFYCFLHWLKSKINPKDISIKLVSIPVKESGHFDVTLDTSKKFRIIETKRTMNDLLTFGIRIKRVHKEMREYVLMKENK